MKAILKKTIPFLLVATLLTLGAVPTACQSSRGSTASGGMYERKKSNSGRTVKSNIKVKGTNKANSHTNRSY